MRMHADKQNAKLDHTFAVRSYAKQQRKKIWQKYKKIIKDEF